MFGNIGLSLVAVDEMFARMGLQILGDTCINWIRLAGLYVLCMSMLEQPHFGGCSSMQMFDFSYKGTA